MNRKKILITGGSGFIGRKLIARLAEEKYEIIAPSHSDLNVSEHGCYSKYKDLNISHVVHLAARTFVPESWEIPDEFIKTNVMGTVRTLEFCKENGCKLTYLSSYVYGSPDKLPVNEECEVQPANPYALSKIMAEDVCRFYNKNMDIEMTIFRPFNIYGFGQDINFLLPILVDQVLKSGDTIQVQTLPPKRDYIYIDDVVDAICKSLEFTSGYNLYNLGYGQSFSVEEVIDLLQKIAGTNKKIVSKNESRKNEIMDVVADISAIKREWNWSPKVSLENGLRMYVDEAKGVK